MTVIDVAQRAASRDRAPHIAFYRTEADRRPARRVAMPNDGPDPDRFAKSEAARAKLNVKPATTPFLPPRIEALVRALVGGPKSRVELSEILAVKPTTVADRAQTAKTLGVIDALHYAGGQHRYRITKLGSKTLAEIDAA